MASSRPIEGIEAKLSQDKTRVQANVPADRDRDHKVPSRTAPGLITPVSAYTPGASMTVQVPVNAQELTPQPPRTEATIPGVFDPAGGSKTADSTETVVDTGEDDYVGVNKPSKKSEPMTAQARFLKETQDAFKMYHKYPSESFMIYPPDGSMGDAAMDGAENEDDGSTRRPIFVWRPELAYPEAFEGGRPPCPRCKTSTHVTSKGWMQHGSRRGILREGSCDLTCYWYSCKKCREDNKDKPKGARVPEAFKGWDSGVLAQLPLHVQAMFPFVLRTRSALHVDVATSESSP